MTQEDFCNITIRLEDCTFALIRQVENVALVRSFRSIPIDEFDRIAIPLIEYPQHFSRMFKKHFGESPSQYLNSKL